MGDDQEHAQSGPRRGHGKWWVYLHRVLVADPAGRVILFNRQGGARARFSRKTKRAVSMDSASDCAHGDGEAPVYLASPRICDPAAEPS